MPRPAKAARANARAPIWDAPLRLFHWSIAALVGLAWWTAQTDQMPLHRLCGCAIAGLLAFRLWWGFAGGSTARFSSFVKGPKAVFAYAVDLVRRRTAPSPPGHNPMGGWSVLALLMVMAAVVGFGLFSVDVDGVESGPFAAKVSFEAGRLAAHWHHLLFNALLALIVLHLVAIAFYAVVKRDNLIGPMLSGYKAGDAGLEPIRGAQPWRMVVGLVIAFAVATALMNA